MGGDLDPQIAAAIDEGAQAIEALPSHAARLAGLIGAQFPPMTLEAVAKEMSNVEKGAVNAKLHALGTLVREEAAVAAAQFRSAEMWIRLKAPMVSDGNNFGVDVQNFVLGELQAMRTAMDAMVICGRDYHWSRGTGLDKLFGDDRTENATSETKDVSTEKDGKTTESVKKTTASKSTSSSPPNYPDYREYVVSLDVRQYHLIFNHLTDMRNNYLKAHVLFVKNMKKLDDPRGEGTDGSSRNVMSMF